MERKRSAWRLTCFREVVFLLSDDVNQKRAASVIQRGTLSVRPVHFVIPQREMPKTSRPSHVHKKHNSHIKVAGFRRRIFMFIYAFLKGSFVYIRAFL